jgi:N-acetylmuramoyl-L-alanine amidase
MKNILSKLKPACKAIMLAFCCASVLFSFTSIAPGLHTDIQASGNNINLLARLISAEARGEPYAAQVAVGSVILNRVRHAAFPNSISAVIYQPGAFASIKNGRFDRPVSESAFRAARDALNNIDPSGGSLYFYNPKSSANQWLRSRPVIASIGSYIFC